MTRPPSPHRLGAVVLSGGGGARLGGADKASIEIAGRTLLEHALAAVADIAEVVVVGADVPTSRPVTFAREDPAGGGPAAGLLAGIRRFAQTPRRVLVLAVDMPLVSTDTVGRLLAAAEEDGAVLIDGDGRAQYLCAVYSVDALEQARGECGTDTGHGLAMHRLVQSLRLAEVPAVGAESHDLDTWEDLADLREGRESRESRESLKGTVGRPPADREGHA